jgi:hypothetical protein
MTLQKFFL